jgi:hypothetical protein
MDNVAGLNDANSQDIFRGIVYGITAIVLMITSYVLFTRKYRASKTEVVNTLEFITSRYNIYTENVQFLYKVPFKMHISLNLVDENENIVEVLTNSEFSEGEHVIKFESSKYANGFYFLELKAENINLLRKIKINVV